MDFSPSERTRKLQAALEAFMVAEVYPKEAEFFAEVAENRRKGNPWVPTKTIEVLKEKARGQKLWNLSLPESELAAGLTNLEYAPLCEIMDCSFIGSVALYCRDSDTGYKEVIVRYYSHQHK